MNRSAYNKEYYLKNRERLIAEQKAHDAGRKEEKVKYNKEYAAKNKEKIAVQRKQYRIEKRAECAARCKDWYVNNAEYAKAKAKEYRDSHKDELRAYHSRKNILREKSDPLFKFRRRIRSLIGIKIRQGGYTKRSKTFDILGCSYPEFIDHISSQFAEGMTWDNYGQWHIDHIIPVAAATTEDDVIRLNHYSNLRPLWALDNLRKGSKVDEIATVHILGS